MQVLKQETRPVVLKQESMAAVTAMKALGVAIDGMSPGNIADDLAQIVKSAIQYSNRYVGLRNKNALGDLTTQVVTKIKAVLKTL